MCWYWLLACVDYIVIFRRYRLLAWDYYGLKYYLQRIIFSIFFICEVSSILISPRCLTIAPWPSTPHHPTPSHTTPLLIPDPLHPTSQPGPMSPSHYRLHQRIVNPSRKQPTSSRSLPSAPGARGRASAGGAESRVVGATGGGAGAGGGGNSFFGCQTFFKSFIEVASCQSFNTLLETALIRDISKVCGWV